MTPSQAEELLDMFADGKLIDSVNTSLALHLVELAREMGRDALLQDFSTTQLKFRLHPKTRAGVNLS